MERPGWFQPPDDNQPAPPLPYDFYGAYGNESHSHHRYKDLVEWECTYDIPPHLHSVIKRESSAVRQRVAVFNQSSFGKFFLLTPHGKSG